MNIKTFPCATCEHNELCKYADEMKQEFDKLQNSNHPLFEKKIICRKFKDTRCK